MRVVTGSKELATAQATYSNKDFKEYYIGGAPQDLRERYVVINCVL